VGYPGAAAQFKALAFNDGTRDNALLWFHVQAESGAVADTDHVFVGFWDGAGTAYALQVRRDMGATGASGATNLGGILFLKNTGTAAVPIWAAQPTPTWLSGDNTNVIVEVCGGAPTPTCTWTFRLRVPFDPGAADATNGLNMSPAGFRFWYEMHVVHSGNNLVTYNLPSSSANLATMGGAPVPHLTAPPPQSTWVNAQLSAAGATCRAVRLAPEMISVTYPGSASSSEISALQTNTFSVQPVNESGGTIPRGAVQARLRIADFGSSTNWRSLPATSTCENAADNGAGNVAAYNPPNAADHFNLLCTWQLTNQADRCFYRPDKVPGCTDGPIHAHQCILAELFASGAVPVAFSVQSAFRNMDFGTASWFQRYAKLDLAGVDLPPGPAHDVYLYVKASNLPATSKEKVAVGTQQAARYRELLTSGGIDFAGLERVMPTYTVYAWYDTGRTHAEGGRTLKVLAPRPSFGYFLSHDGALTGWDHRLAAQGTLTTISPNYYRISVPRGQEVSLWTAVGALDERTTAANAPRPFWEKGPGPRPFWDGWEWWQRILLLLLVVLALAAVWFIVRRKH
jgi:hypothetical protein